MNSLLVDMSASSEVIGGNRAGACSVVLHADNDAGTVYNSYNVVFLVKNFTVLLGEKDILYSKACSRNV